MIIRNAQLEVFDQDSRRRFEDELVAHITTFASRHAEVIGEAGVRQVIRLGIDSSSQYGLTTRGAVRFYIELMFMFGSYFDTDVQHPWATGALNDKLVSATFRADLLHQKMLSYLDAVSGPDHVYAKNALRATRTMASEEPPSDRVRLRLDLISRTEKVYPEKCAWLGRQRLGATVDGGIAVARANDVTSARGIRLFAVLAFALGHGFVRDPLFPWISNTLKRSVAADPNLKAERLEAKSLLYLDQVLGYLERK